MLLVDQNDYDNCNNNSPIQKWDDGGTAFTFNRSGLFFFISGQDDHCQNGQKLVVLVLSLRRQPPKGQAQPVANRPCTFITIDRNCSASLHRPESYKNFFFFLDLIFPFLVSRMIAFLQLSPSVFIVSSPFVICIFHVLI